MTSTLSIDPRLPRPAATVLVLRDAPDGMEVLMLRRADGPGDFGGATVFPGGALDDHDRALHDRCAGLDDAEASRRLGVAAHGLDWYVGAVRECFEEAGVLYAADRDGALVDLDALGAAAVAALRDAARRGGVELQRLCERLDLRLAVDRLAYLAHWITPPGRPKRFDTRFFVAAAPPGQTPLHDGCETVDHVWLRPQDAIDPRRGLKLITATRHVLQSISMYTTVDACLAHARGLRGITPTMPRRAMQKGVQRAVLPREPAYAEIARVDPEGRGDALAEIVPGTPVRLSPRVLRVTAGNPGAMTGPGTNTYLVGHGDGEAGDWAVIDPGPDDPAHVAAVLAAAPGPIRRILVTHTHRDHSPAAAMLREATGAELLGRVAAYPNGQDETFAPDRTLADGERIAVGGSTLRVLHTPGHASNHLCFLLEDEKLLFTGDHVMQGSTVVIGPPDGEMAAYLASLERLLGEDLDWLAPGHGFLVARPHDAVRGLIRHRLLRESRVAKALRAFGSADLDALVARAYDDVPERLHPVAKRSLLAHLLKLAADGAAVDDDGRWRAVEA